MLVDYLGRELTRVRRFGFVPTDGPRYELAHKQLNDGATADAIGFQFLPEFSDEDAMEVAAKDSRK